MRELICINIGQAGVQISNAIWELMCLEHGISADGVSNLFDFSENVQSCESIFMEVSENQFVPRCLSIDLEPTVIDEIRTGVYRKLFSPIQLISGLEDSSSNFARGHYIIGKIYLPEFLDVMRQLVQLCDSLQGFMITQSAGGGCGSGFTALVLEQLSIEYAKKSRMQFSIFPSSHMSSAIVEPYNTILSGKSCIETTDLCLQHDNQSVYKILDKNLEVINPTFNNINRILAQVFSSLTVSIRYENSLNNDLNQIATNLIPFPRLHYPIDVYSPICNVKGGSHYNCSTAEMTKEVFYFKNKLLDIDYTGEKFISCCLQYRGNVYPSEVNRTIQDIKKMESIMFVDWCPTGYKIGINRQPPTTPKNSFLFDAERSLLLLTNNTCINQKIGDINSKFDILFSRRSFIHWFVGEGMEESEFVESREEFAFLKEDYECLAINDEQDSKDEMDKKIVEQIGTAIEEDEIFEYTQEEKSKHLVTFPERSSQSSSHNYKQLGVESMNVYNDESLHEKISTHSSNVISNKIILIGGDSSGSKIPSESESERNRRIRKFLKEDNSTQSDISTI